MFDDAIVGGHIKAITDVELYNGGQPTLQYQQHEQLQDDTFLAALDIRWTHRRTRRIKMTVNIILLFLLIHVTNGHQRNGQTDGIDQKSQPRHPFRPDMGIHFFSG